MFTLTVLFNRLTQMSSVKINGTKYKVLQRRVSAGERSELGVKEEVVAKTVLTSTGKKPVVKQNDKWAFLENKPHKPMKTVRL